MGNVVTNKDNRRRQKLHLSWVIFFSACCWLHEMAFGIRTTGKLRLEDAPGGRLSLRLAQHGPSSVGLLRSREPLEPGQREPRHCRSALARS